MQPLSRHWKVCYDFIELEKRGLYADRDRFFFFFAEFRFSLTYATTHRKTSRLAAAGSEKWKSISGLYVGALFAAR